MARDRLKWLRRFLRLHRMLGLGLCLLFAVWFASGVVMLFQGYPAFGEAQRLKTVPELSPASGLLSPAELQRSGISLPSGARLRRLRDAPAYLFQGAGGRARAVDARSGEPLPPVGCEDPQALARSAGLKSAADGELLREPDQWTFSGRLAPHFPLCRLELDDAQGTVVYISVSTGELVHRTVRRARALAWLGAIPHWIYPTALRRHREVWRWLVVALASAGTLMCLAGLVAGGWVAWRFRRRTSCFVPYRRGMSRWHHRLGLAFGVLACTWVLSGTLSLDPLGMSAGGESMRRAQKRLRGGPMQPQRAQVAPGDALRRCDRVMGVRELRLEQVLGVPYYVCVEGPRATRILRADVESAPLRRTLGRAVVRRAAESMVPRHGLRSLRRLPNGDAYVYASHFRPHRGHDVVRARYGDGRQAYLDPTEGRLVAFLDASARWHRWLYHGLHSWDMPWLLARDGLRITSMVVALVGGLAASVTAVALGLRRLRRARSRAT